MLEAGDVIPYWYLWWRERERGEESGRKLRPCVVLVVILQSDGEPSRFGVLPITHSPPREDDAAVEIPATVKRRLGLDDRRSWIVCDEFNDSAWPGVDLGSTPSGLQIYGKLPRNLFEKARSLALSRIRAGKARAVNRD